jgi:hypothetical protein
VALEHSYDVRNSFEEYLELVERYPDNRFEYIGGYAYMMTGGTLNHARITANITGILYQSLLGKGCFRERWNLWTLHRFGLADTIELTSVNVVLSVAAIYRDIHFSESPDDSSDPV